MSSTPPEAQQVADHALGAADRQPMGVSAEYLLDRLSFGNVAQRRARAVGIDVVHVFGVEAAS